MNQNYEGSGRFILKWDFKVYTVLIRLQVWCNLLSNWIDAENNDRLVECRAILEIFRLQTSRDLFFYLIDFI